MIESIKCVNGCEENGKKKRKKAFVTIILDVKDMQTGRLSNSNYLGNLFVVYEGTLLKSKKKL